MALSITDRDNYYTFDSIQVVRDETGSVLKASQFVTYEDFIKKEPAFFILESALSSLDLESPENDFAEDLVPLFE